MSKKTPKCSEGSGEYTFEEMSEESGASLPTPPPSVKIERGLGWKPCPTDARDYSAGSMLGAPTNLPPEWLALAALTGFVYNQLFTSACVGFAIRNAIQIRLRALGRFLEEWSAYAIYAWARMRGKSDPGDAIHDEGSIPRLAMQALKEDGVPAEKDWPADPSHVNDELTWDAQQKASAGRIAAYYRIDTEGDSLVQEIMHALVQMYPVVFGMFVDTAFMRLGAHNAPVSVVNVSDPNGGGHMMCIVGYRTRNGVREFLVFNSWSKDWGNDGLCWIHEDVLKRNGGDFFVMQVS